MDAEWTRYFTWSKADKLCPLMGQHKRQWRDYATVAGRRPVVDFLDALRAKHLDQDVIEILKSMKRVANLGTVEARHLRGDVYEVRASGRDAIYRVLFSSEGRYGQVLLSLEAFSKKTQKTPPAKIKLAEERLRDWRKRGEK